MASSPIGVHLTLAPTSLVRQSPLSRGMCPETSCGCLKPWAVLTPAYAMTLLNLYTCGKQALYFTRHCKITNNEIQQWPQYTVAKALWMFSLRTLAWISLPFFTSAWRDLFLAQISAISAYSFFSFLKSRTFTFPLQGNTYGFSLACLNCQPHYTCTSVK